MAAGMEVLDHGVLYKPGQKARKVHLHPVCLSQWSWADLAGEQNGRLGPGAKSHRDNHGPEAQDVNIYPQGSPTHSMALTSQSWKPSRQEVLQFAHFPPTDNHTHTHTLSLFVALALFRFLSSLRFCLCHCQGQSSRIG